MGAHELSSVQEGKSFLRLKPYRFPVQFFPKFRSLAYFSIIEDLTKSYQRKAHVGEGSEVSRSAEGSLLIDNRKYVVVEHVDETLHCHQLHS